MAAGREEDTVFAVPPPLKSKQPEEQTPLTTASQEHVSETDKQEQPPVPPLPYDPPAWSSEPTAQYYFEVLKNGAIIHQTPVITKPYIVVGRLPVCDIDMEHPSVSRYHAVFQFGQSDTHGNGIHLYDLGSSHGTYLNKNRVLSRQYVKLRVGDMIRFGQSSRLFILGGPESTNDHDDVHEEPVDDDDRDSEKSADTSQHKSATEILDRQEATWGFTEDAYETDDQVQQPSSSISIDDDDDLDTIFASARPDENATYYDDPKKSLRVWCEVRGIDLNVQVEEEGHGVTRGFMARLEIPVRINRNGSSGMRTVRVSSVGHGMRKKQAEREACLQMCAKLDRIGVLKSAPSQQRGVGSSKERIDDEYDDDEDTFYDRTKDSNANTGATSQTETYDTLKTKRDQVLVELHDLESQEKKDQEHQETKIDEDDQDDELDKYMSQIKTTMHTQTTTSRQSRIQTLQTQLQKLEKMIKLVAPSNVTSIPVQAKTPKSKEGNRVTVPVSIDYAGLESPKPSTKRPYQDHDDGEPSQHSEEHSRKQFSSSTVENASNQKEKNEMKRRKFHVPTREESEN